MEPPVNRRHACAMLAGAGALAATACAPGRAVPGQALLVGAAAPMLALVQALAAGFARSAAGGEAGPRAPAVLVEPGGSLPAYIAASRGAIDVAAMARPLQDGEDGAGARHHLVARDAIGIAAHRACPVRALAREQVRALLAGEIANWRALGGPDLLVTVYAPARATPARQAAEQLLLGGAEFAVNARDCADHAALCAALRLDPGALGVFEGRASAGTRAADTPTLLAVDGVPPTRATVLSGRYPYTQSFYLLLHGARGDCADGSRDDPREAFVRFARSGAGQRIVQALGFIAVR